MFQGFLCVFLCCLYALYYICYAGNSGRVMYLPVRISIVCIHCNRSIMEVSICCAGLCQSSVTQERSFMC